MSMVNCHFILGAVEYFGTENKHYAINISTSQVGIANDTYFLCGSSSQLEMGAKYLIDLMQAVPAIHH
jgi:hypothetical protein